MGVPENSKIAVLVSTEKFKNIDFQTVLQELPHLSDSQMFFFEKNEDLKTHLLQLKDKHFSRALICGGDGSLHYAVEEILKIQPEKRIPLGIIPIGTANDFARSAGILKEDLAEAVQTAALSDVQKIDIGWVNEKPFINVVTGGDVAKITTSISPVAKSLFGKTAYYLNSLVHLPSLTCHRMTFRGSDWEISQDCFAFTVGNNSSAGGGMKVAPFARLNDGLLELLIIPKLSFLEMTALAAEFAKEEPNLSEHRVLYRRTRDFTVTSDDEIQINVDGEPQIGRHFHFKVTPKLLDMAFSNEKLLLS